MHTGRLEAFSDGVIAIIITIMVLELRIPADLHGHARETSKVLHELWPTLLSYILSFVYLGIYWNNHHHLFQAAKQLNGTVLWANLHLLFWLSLIPFTTHWMGDTTFATLPVAVYGVVLLMTAAAYETLAIVLIRGHHENAALARALAKDWKDKASLACYSAAIPLAWLTVWASVALYTAVAVLWFVPDKRIEEELIE